MLHYFYKWEDNIKVFRYLSDKISLINFFYVEQQMFSLNVAIYGFEREIYTKKAVQISREKKIFVL